MKGLQRGGRSATPGRTDDAPPADAATLAISFAQRLWRFTTDDAVTPAALMIPLVQSARERVIAAALGRLERLTRKMLRGFPGVGRWEETGDVLQNALLRLDRALRAVVPATPREFFALAAEMIRRELIDLARKHGGAHGVGANHDTGYRVGGTEAAALDPSAPADEPDALEKWSAFHEAVEHLPAAEREVFMLAFYHKWKHSDIAGLFQVDERTVRRRWAAAVDALADRLGGDVPDG